ncbi:helix-turn-helix transcriptional regulator [Pseudoduganella namucuonensis]|uniref:Transcriptional regulator n=1 Tax=Pseudoduganella namucuonensis TaxID=1035707 RepID=A0A1I7M5M9_9BURK|nr:YafY family protein [Pseudoduganella namucuonensis]SFV17251.1 transcriptional regulator [Pseudoduganella namucuonensis]
MYHPTTRVLAVLELLQTHGRLSGADMAARLEVDGRTLRRYIVMLEQIGIPIMSERGRHGGYALMPGFKLPPMMFTDDEALALSLGLLAARGLGLAEAAPAVASAQAKLERIMPAGLKQRVGAIDETVRLDLARATAAPRDNAALVTLSAAAQARRRVHLRYRAPGGGDSERGFDPYGLAFREGCWYAVGHCHLRRELRTFRLDRIVSAAPLPHGFSRPEGFDALAHLRTSFAAMPRAHATTVLLKTDLATAQRYLMDAIGLFEQTGEGVLLHNQSDELDWFARELARLPFEFHIIGPESLRAELAAVAARLARLSSQAAIR